MEAPTNGSIRVTQHPVDWEDPAQGVIERLTPLALLPEYRNHQATLLRHLLREEKYGTLFLNPMFTVEADSPSVRFFFEAKRAQRHWLMEFKTWIAVKPSILKSLIKYYREQHPLLCQLNITGVMIVEG